MADQELHQGLDKPKGQLAPRSEDAVAAGLFAQVFAGDLSAGSMAALRQMYGIKGSDDDVLATHYEVFVHQVPIQAGLFLGVNPEEMNRYVRGLTFYLYRCGLEPPRGDFSPDHLTNLLACAALLLENQPDLAKKFLGYHLRSWMLPLQGAFDRQGLGCFATPVNDFFEWVASVSDMTADVPVLPTETPDPEKCDLDSLKTYLLTPARAGAFFSHQTIRNWGRICSFQGSNTPRSQTLTALLKWATDREQLFQLLQYIQRDCKVLQEQLQKVIWYDDGIDGIWISRLDATCELLDQMMDVAEKA